MEPKQREPPVKYAVGLIMKHKIHGHLCVITGWDVHRKESKVWMNELNVDHLEASPDQPFYYTCMDDGSSHYVAQGNGNFVARIYSIKTREATGSSEAG